MRRRCVGVRLFAGQIRKLARAAMPIGLGALLGAAAVVPANAQGHLRDWWGSITAPVYGTSENGVYSGAELFAGPMKFGTDYYHGVLPNGRIVHPAGVSAQVGMNPLGAALTPDGKYLVTTNDDERDGTGASSLSLRSPLNRGGYSLTVLNTDTMSPVSQINTAGSFFIGLQVTRTGPYAVWASGGPDNNVKLFTVSSAGAISGPTATIPILPITPANKGFVSNYTPDAAFNTADASGNKPPVPTNFSRTGTTQITFPAGSALSPDGRFLYVACNGDNSLAVIDTLSRSMVRQVPVGYFPYGVSVSGDGSQVLVVNWGITRYQFAHPTYDPVTGKLTALGTAGPNQPEGFFVPLTSTGGPDPQTSSVTVVEAPSANGMKVEVEGALYLGKPLDELVQVGDTHPSASAVVRHAGQEVLYVVKSNDDSISLVDLKHDHELHTFDLSPLALRRRCARAICRPLRTWQRRLGFTVLRNR